MHVLNKKINAFTFAELMISLVIIAVITVILYPTLSDLAPNNKLDLTPSSENWDPNKWVTEVQNIKQQLYNLGIQLQLAQATYDEFFKV